MVTNSDIKSFLPLTESTFFIVTSLAYGPKHGYAIMKAAHQMSQGRITFSTGTLYGALKRLLEQGWIVRDSESQETGRARKEYKLTPLGMTILNSEVNRMRNLIQLANLIHFEEA